ncbi:endonuclease/exonuclease/phosphatase family protein [Fulvimonas yonginensis]|uniref:Endonuclease/exonuclease/phosphatase family protein n=1 Tax=Fulvimonas yonginensis TaxID=1495200 RepID=A0ABU8JF00_9GAMM
MHRIRLRTLALVAMLGLAGPLAAQTLRMMSFNVRLPVASDGPNRWEQRRDLLVRTVRERHPDVLGTQELYKLQGDYIVGTLPDYAWFGEGRYGGDRDEHMGVFYRRDRLRLLDSGNFWLSDTPDVPGSISWGHPLPRMVTWARFEDRRNGRTFYYYNTHFPYRDQDTDARNRAAQEIAARVAGLPPHAPVVLTGDFNTEPSSQAHALLGGVLRDARQAVAHPDGPEATFHDFTGTPDRRIDWILVRGFRPLDYATVTTHEGGRYPSDHFPVVTDLEWDTPAK